MKIISEIANLLNISLTLFVKQIHGPSLMEVDWGPKFLENNQVDWGAHHASTNIHLKHDVQYDYPSCNHRISTFTPSKYPLHFQIHI